MNDQPSRPGSKILRAADAANWIDGYAFREQERAQSEALVAETQEVVELARADGYEAGRKAGEAAAAALLLRTGIDVDRYLEGIEARLADLALSIVRKVLVGFDQTELVAAVAGQGLAAFRNAEELVVRVAPPLADQVEELLRSPGEAGPRVRVEADPHLSGCQCIVTSQIASIDVGLDAQLGAIRAAMAGPA